MRSHTLMRNVVVAACCALCVLPAAVSAQSRTGAACTAAPGAPADLVLTQNNGGYAAFSWTAASGAPDTYLIEVGTAPGLADIVNLDLASLETTFSTSGVSAGVSYIRVRARNACGTSGPSNEVVLVVSSPLNWARRTMLQKTLTEHLDTYHVPGAIAGLWFPGYGTWVVGSGIANRSTGAAPKPSNYVRIGSITKTFTATVILQLVDEGALSLDDKLSRFEPWVPGADRITIRHLLNMTSGLYNYSESPGFAEALASLPNATWTPRQLVEIAIAFPAGFSPGERYQYCNTNYILLGMIIERVTGRTAAHEITTRIIDKLGLTHTSFPMTSDLPAPYMHGYTERLTVGRGSTDLVDMTLYGTSAFWTAGAMVSTIDDLKIWMETLAAGGLLSETLHAEQLNFSSPNTSSYGLGVMNLGGLGFGHSGQVPGYNSSMYYSPSLGATFITLINRCPTEPEGVADTINLALAGLMVDDPRMDFVFTGSYDLSFLPWSYAFVWGLQTLSREYAFTEWKGIDWRALFEQFAPRLYKADLAEDEKAYFLAMQEFVAQIPDGHVGLDLGDSPVPAAAAKELAGGGFGLAVAELDDWRVVAAAVPAGGPAALAGIVAGAEIAFWGGQPAGIAIGRIDPRAFPLRALTGRLGSISPQATWAHARLEQARLLTRAPIGTEVRVVFRNPGSAAFRSATLKAVDDAGQSFALLDFAKRAEFTDAIDFRVLPEGYGYIRLRMEHDLSLPGYPARLVEDFRTAIGTMFRASVPAIILDLRGNYGGSDQMAADVCGFFARSSSVYEYQEYYDQRTGKFIRLTVDESGLLPFVENISITPQKPLFRGTVIALVNPGTISSGEGPAMCISQMKNGRVIGFHGTNGSFGMTGGELLLPGGYSITFPTGRSVDANGIIQLDSRNGVGGVQPNPRVPKTLENVLAYAAGTDVELQYAVRFLTDSAIVRTVSAAPTTLTFAATKNGAAGALTSVSGAQAVTVGFGADALLWTATSSQSWLQITGGSGSAAGQFTVAIQNPGNVIGGATTLTGAITITADEAANSPLTIPVVLTVVQAGGESTAPPFGAFDLPADGAAGVQGSIAVTGWALDDIGVTKVELWRDVVAGEPAGAANADPAHPAVGKVYIGDALFVDGTRPDVELKYPGYPFAHRAGWGYLMLSWGLPNQGNGSYRLHAYAYDAAGHATLLGSKTIAVDNAHAVRPFGAIDTPVYGGTVAGGLWNYGWALTPPASPVCTIGDGGVLVGIDSGPLVAVTSGDARTDIAAAFPAFSNSANAGGHAWVDTTRLSNGMHTIAWMVTDSCGRSDGVGGRFFTVLNTSGDTAGGSVPAGRPATADGPIPAARMDASQGSGQLLRRRVSGVEPGVAAGAGSLSVRLGGGEWHVVSGDAEGNLVVSVASGERLELKVPLSGQEARLEGYHAINGLQRPLPIGSSLDESLGIFYWQPAPGFLGDFDLVFVTAGGTAPGGETRIRIQVR